MRKSHLLLCLVSLFSFLFFSCASTKKKPAKKPSAPKTVKEAPAKEATPKTEEKPAPQEKSETVEFITEENDEKTSDDVAVEFSNKEESSENLAAEESEAEDTTVQTEASETETNFNDEENIEKDSDPKSDSETEDTAIQTESSENSYLPPELSIIEEPEVFEAELPPLPAKKDPVLSEPVLDDETPKLPALPEETAGGLNISVSNDDEVPEISEDDSDHNDAVSNTEDDFVEEVISENQNRDDEVEDLISDSDESTDTPEEETALEETEEIIPSRSVSMKKNETLDVEYPGKGWVFLGCTDGSKNLSSTGRKTGTSTTSFTLMARVSGTVILHFYKEDILSGNYIDDYLEVTVSEIKSKPSVHVKAPDYSEAVPKKPEPKKAEEIKEQKEQKKTAEPVKEEVSIEKEPVSIKTEPYREQTFVQPDEEKEEPVKTYSYSESYTVLSGEEYMAAAKKALDEKNYSEVYNNLHNFLTVSDKNRDEALFLLAQLYEGNSEFRNIKKSVETYEELTAGYPLSQYWEEANKRAVYLKRFYINIR